MKKRIPTGRIYQKSWRDAQGRRHRTETWYLKYYVHGKAVEVSTGERDYEEALQMLRRKLAEAPVKHEHQPELVRMDQLFDLLLDDYRFQKRKSAYDVELRVKKHLRPFFGERKAQAMTTTVLREYVERRRRQEAEPGTINKELAFVRRSMRLGHEHEPRLVLHVPAFKMMPLDNAREGTLTHDQYRTVRDALPAYARIALVIGYHTGARAGEIKAIQLDRIDLKRKRIDLPGRNVKNGEFRYLPIYGDMAAELEIAIARCKKSCPFLMQEDGVRVRDFEKSWATACEDADVPAAMFHDLRRTALTNMIEAGLSEKEAMEISGHKTRAVFDRYHIVSDRRLQQNAQKLGEFLKAKEVPEAECPASTKGLVN